jgi:predicted nucleic acid-binding protein
MSLPLRNVTLAHKALLNLSNTWEKTVRLTLRHLRHLRLCSVVSSFMFSTYDNMMTNEILTDTRTTLGEEDMTEEDLYDYYGRDKDFDRD